MTYLFPQTLREAPSDAEFTSQRLLVRGGFIHQLASGIFSMLPLGYRVQKKIENILSEEMDAISGQEMLMPVVHPAEIWKETGRWYQIGSELGRFTSSTGRDMVLAMTHEEVVADLVRDFINSYRQLPALIYHIQTKWRDEPRARGGLIRVREFIMKDSYSLDKDWDGLDKQYWNHYEAYFRIFNRCGLPTIAVQSDVGMMGGTQAHEFIYITPIGEDTLIQCDSCGYTSNLQVATFRKPDYEPEKLKPLEKIMTPDTTTIVNLAQLLQVPERKTAKAIFMVGKNTEGEQETERFILAVVRGDMNLNETKLSNAVKAKELRLAHEDEIRTVGTSPGYGSPIGISRENIIVVIDDLVAKSPNLVAGANEDGYHLINTNYGRDYTANIVTDIVDAEDGYPCAQCGKPLRTSRGVEVGNIFKLGTRYSAAMNATFQDRDGIHKPVVMGSYGIGIGRLIACVVEEHHDDYGIIWPITIAPYHVHIVPIKGGHETAEQIYHSLQDSGMEVLIDDRDESSGVKFNDADLIGIPLRITVGGRSLEKGGVEVKRRDSGETKIVAVDEIVPYIKEEIIRLQTSMLETYTRDIVI